MPAELHITLYEARSQPEVLVHGLRAALGQCDGYKVALIAGRPKAEDALRLLR